jgi:hypothetical protein
MTSPSDFSVNFIDPEDSQEKTRVCHTQEEAEEFIKSGINWLECNFIPSWMRSKLENHFQ